jgi:hypothetical protein
MKLFAKLQKHVQLLEPSLSHPPYFPVLHLKSVALLLDIVQLSLNAVELLPFLPPTEQDRDQRRDQ